MFNTTEKVFLGNYECLVCLKDLHCEENIKKCYQNNCCGIVIFCDECYLAHKRFHLNKHYPTKAIIDKIINPNYWSSPKGNNMF